MKSQFLLLFLLMETIFQINTRKLECLCNDHKDCLNSEFEQNINSIPTAINSEIKYLHPEISQNLHLNETQKELLSTFGICRIDPEGKCYTSKSFYYLKKISDDNKNVKLSHMIIKYGCISSHQHSTLSCKSHLVKHEEPKTIACCNSSDQCNFHLDPYFHHYNSSEDAQNDMPVLTTPSPASPYRRHIVTLLVLLVSGIGFSILTVAFCIFCLIYRKKFHHLARTRLEDPLSMANTSMTTASTSVHPGHQPFEALMMQEFNSYDRNSDLIPSNMNNTSGSGSGPLLLTQRTVCNQLSLDKLLGQGRFGQVWLGEWRGEEVAVKLFHSGPVGEGCWRHEIALHCRVLMRHPGVLSLIASDRLTTGSVHRPLLVTEYMAGGSLLHCFINRKFYEDSNDKVCESPDQTVSFLQNRLLQMSEDIVCGLDYLHTEISGTYGKSGIAHRDLKPSNIYIKSNWSCCIGDFSLAVTQHTPAANQHLTCQQTTQNQIENTQDLLMGEEGEEDGNPFLIGGLHASTPRYTAPEILDESVNCQSFEVFKKADIYSLGLIFWELARWCAPIELMTFPISTDQLNGHLASPSQEDSHSFNLPYYPVYQEDFLLHYGPPKLRDLMTSDCDSTNDLVECEWNEEDEEPCLQEVRHIVCELKRRPTLPSHWSAELLSKMAPVTHYLSKLMIECWSHHNYSRLTSLRIKKNLKKFHEEFNIFDLTESTTTIINGGASIPTSDSRNC